MFSVKIGLENGREVYFVETSFIRAVARVEEYHEQMLWCNVNDMDRGEEIGNQASG